VQGDTCTSHTKTQNMKLLSTYLRGKSLTVCFAFPEDYDMANIEAFNVSIGSKQFTGDDIDISGQLACVRLKSEDTYKLTGDYPIIISIDDKTRGVIPIPVGDIRFVTHRNSLNNASTNEQNDIVIALSITQTTINVDSVLYDVMAGKAATIEVGTVTTLEAGEDATIENTGTENEAVFNFGIPKGDKGDKGDAGYTPYIGVNGNWFINGVDTGVQAEGDATEAWVAQNYLSKLAVVGELGDSETKVVNQQGVTAGINQSISFNTGNIFSINGKYIYSHTGIEMDFADTSCTPFLEIDIKSPIKVRGRGTDAAALVAFYDVNKIFISSIYGREYSNILTTIPVESIPTNAVYIRATCTTTYGGELYAGFSLGISQNIQRNIDKTKQVEDDTHLDVSGNPFVLKDTFISISNGGTGSIAGINSTNLLIFNRNHRIRIFGRGSTGSALIAFYDANKVFISSISGTQYQNTLTTIPVESIPVNAVYLRASCNDNYGGLLIADFTTSLLAKVENLNTSILTESRGIVGNLFYKTNTYILKTTGAEVPVSGVSCTGFIVFDKNESITVKGRGNPAVALVAFYDKFKNFISSIGGTEYNEILTTIPVESIPTNAVYLRATCTTSNGGTLKCGIVLGNLSLIENLRQELKELKENYLGDLFSIRENYINNSGVQTSFADASCTPFIKVNANYPIRVKGRSNAVTSLIAFYDANKVFISKIGGTEYNQVLTTIPVENIPVGTKYVRATCTTNNVDRLLEASLVVGLLEEINNVVDKQNSEPYINVTKKYPPVSGYHTKQSARTAIPAPFRISGLVISYQTGANVWIKEMFIGSNVAEWVRESYWQKLNKEDVTESTTELQGDEMVLSGIQDGKEKLMPIKQLQEFFINSQNGFPQPENTLFYPSHIDLINNKWVDKSGNQNDADLVQSNCGTAKVGTIMTFNEPLEGNLGDWVITNDGTAVPVLALDKITFSDAGTIYNLRLVNETINKYHYYPISEGTIAVYDCSGNSNHITITGSTVQEWTANKQDEFHYNLKRGGGLVDNSGLLSNPTMTGTYIDGKAPGCGLYNAISASEETSITIHGQAQRVVTAVVGGSLTIDGIKRKYKVGDIIKTITKVYVVSGKVNGYAIGNDLKSISLFESKTTGEWETIESYVLVASNAHPTHSVYIRATATNTEFIVGEVKTEVISKKVIVPALENSPYDALGNALDVMPKSIFKVETGVKFPVNSELIDADVENYLFDVSQNANTIILNDDRFALKNMIFDNRIFFNPDTNQMFIFKQSLDINSMKGLLNKWAKSSIHIYRLPEEYSLIGKERIDVRDVNRNFRVGINQSGLLCVSNDYGKTWSAGVNYSPADGIHHIFITSKGAVVIFYHKSVIKRMGWGENTFTSIYPVDENGDPIEMHSPVNPLWPGEYYKPYHKLLDLYEPSDNTSLIAWGTWNNNAGSNGAAPQALWYSIDDMVTIKRFYYFGQNPQYTDLGTSTAGPGGVLLGDPTNPIICRHTHEFSYNKYDGKIYITCGDSHVRPELHIFETKYNKSTDTWDELVDLVDDENRNQIHRAIGIGFDKDGYFYFGSDADFVPHTHNGVEYDVQGMFKVHKSNINDISKYELLHPAKDLVVNSYMVDDIILFSAANQVNIVHISLDRGKTWNTIDFEPYMREGYPFDKRVVTWRSVASFKIDSQKNIHVNCGTGVYVNISNNNQLI